MGSARRGPLGAGDVIRPFRWDIAQRRQLETLPDVGLEEPYPAFEADLLRGAAARRSRNDRLRLLNVFKDYSDGVGAEYQ